MAIETRRRAPRCGWLWMATALGCFAGLLNGCGGDKKSRPDAGEPCPTPGNSETGCVCSANQPMGYRVCNQNEIWSPCICPASQKAQQCIEGQPVTCSVCPGETVGRQTTCLQSGTYDCSCSTTSTSSAGRGR